MPIYHPHFRGFAKMNIYKGYCRSRNSLREVTAAVPITIQAFGRKSVSV